MERQTGAGAGEKLGQESGGEHRGSHVILDGIIKAPHPKR